MNINKEKHAMQHFWLQEFVVKRSTKHEDCTPSMLPAHVRLTHQCALLILSHLSPVVKCSLSQSAVFTSRKGQVTQLHTESSCFSDKSGKCCHCDPLLPSFFLESGMMLGATKAFWGSHLAIGQEYCRDGSTEIASFSWWINTINCLSPAFILCKK